MKIAKIQHGEGPSCSEAQHPGVERVSSLLSAGFPSPAQDYTEGPIDLNTLFIPHPAATFFVTVTGNSMERAGIFDGDDLLVDRSITPAAGMVVVAVVDGEFTCKRLQYWKNIAVLVAESPSRYPILRSDQHEITMWGVATMSFHRLAVRRASMCARMKEAPEPEVFQESLFSLG